jgi:multidrug efflux pump subunit AcrA (membrane-fusion protein)
MREYQRTRGAALTALAAGLLAAVGCAPSAAPHDSPTKTTATPTVRAIAPEWKALQRVVEQPGTIQAYEETRVFARIPGNVRLAFDNKGRIINDIGRKIRGPKWYRRGDVLAELVVPELQEETRQKQAMVRQAEAEVGRTIKAQAAAEANITVAQASVTEAQALYNRWESEAKRMTGLVDEKLISRQNRDETLKQFQATEARLASARATVQKATADRDKTEADVQAAKASVDVARADAARVEALLDYSNIRAPYDGIITQRKVSTGALVQPTGGQGDWLFTVAQLNPVRVVVAVPELDANLIQEGAEGKVTVQSVSGPDLSGKVARTSWSLEPGSRTLRVEIELPNDGRLRPGMYVYAHLVGQSPSAWTLPVSAVAKEGDTLVCFRIEGDKVVRTPVRLGRSDGQSVEVRKWLKPGSPAEWREFTKNEKVAVRAAGLSDGQTVQVERSGN